MVTKSTFGRLGFGIVDFLYQLLISVQLIAVVVLFFVIRTNNTKPHTLLHIVIILLSLYYLYILMNSGPEGGTWNS